MGLREADPARTPLRMRRFRAVRSRNSGLDRVALSLKVRPGHFCARLCWPPAASPGASSLASRSMTRGAGRPRLTGRLVPDGWRVTVASKSRRKTETTRARSTVGHPGWLDLPLRGTPARTAYVVS